MSVALLPESRLMQLVVLAVLTRSSSVVHTRRSSGGTRACRVMELAPSQFSLPKSRRNELACQRHPLLCGPWEIQAVH